MKMGSIRSDDDEIKHFKGNSDFDTGDTQRVEFDSQYSPFSGEENDDIFYGLQYFGSGNAQTLDDTVFATDAFETQRMDFDGETQQLNLEEETLVIDFREETQMHHGGDCSGTMETQLCEFDEEDVGGSDEGDPVGTKVLTNREDSTDKYTFKRSSDKALGSGGMLLPPIGGQDEAESKPICSVHSVDTTCSSGSVRRGFTSIRAAALRASGLSARKKMNFKGLESGDISNPSGIESSEMCGAVDQQPDVGKTNEGAAGLDDESNTKLGSSTARKLVLDDIGIGDHEHRDNTDDGARGENFDQVRSYADGFAGLSYVNSQEPGESSQANALDFVEQFLKVNVCDFDLDMRQLDVANKKPDPAPSVKGTQKLASKVNARCSLAENGVYDWDDSREDEGGGEFLTRNKEMFFSNNFGAQKSLTEPRKPKHHCGMQREKHKKSRDEHNKLRIVNDKVMGLAHSEPKFAFGRKMDQLEEMNVKRNLNSDFKKQLSIDSTSVQPEIEADDAEMLPISDIGVDTQMAAEAIEALSNGRTLAMDGGNAFQGEDCGGKLKIKMAKSSAVKQNSTRKRVYPSEIGVITRSKRTKRTSDLVGDESIHFVASRTHSKNARKQVAKGKATSGMDNTASDKRSFKVKDKVEEGTPERNLDDNGCIPAKKRSIENKNNTTAPVASRTRKNVLATVTTANTASESSDDPKSKVQVLETVASDGNRRKRNDSGSDAKEKALELTTMRDSIHSDKLACSGGKFRSSSVQFSKNGKSKGSLDESARHDLETQSITRRRRSKRGVLSPKQLKATKSSNEDNSCCSPTAEKAQQECPTLGTPKEMEKSPLSFCTTPVNCRTSINTVSPVCMGDEYYKLSSKKNLVRSSLMKKINSLTSSGPKCSLADKGLRKRRDMASVRVLFSHHLDVDIIRHQKKILARLGVPTVSSITDATHFVTDEFVRTRNMLEAIAYGKPVVNHLWLESCAQAGCYIDEKNYILRDAKKEKELGFNMPVSLACAIQHPLLEGRRVLITPKTKPGVQILSSLVKAVHGQAFERIGRSIYKDDKLRDDLLVLSCEEDYEFCMPLLEKGAEVYSSELLLNGIIVQKLEFERHRLFLDHVKRTRSTIWLKKDGKEFHSVNRRV